MQKMSPLLVNENIVGIPVKRPDPIWERRCDLQGQVLKVGWIFSMPYVYFEGFFGDPRGTQEAQAERRPTQKNLTGMFYDIAQSMAHRCNFSIDLKEVERYGGYVNGTWTGMLGRLRKHELDMGIADLTPTKQRSKVADFSIGLRNTDFVLFQAPSKKTFNYEIYKNVFSNMFWMCLFVSIFSLTSCLFLIQFRSMGRYTIFRFYFLRLTSKVSR